jgi:hypothetical protein
LGGDATEKDDADAMGAGCAADGVLNAKEADDAKTGAAAGAGALKDAAAGLDFMRPASIEGLDRPSPVVIVVAGATTGADGWADATGAKAGVALCAGFCDCDGLSSQDADDTAAGAPAAGAAESSESHDAPPLAGAVTGAGTASAAGTAAAAAGVGAADAAGGAAGAGTK